MKHKHKKSANGSKQKEELVIIDQCLGTRFKPETQYLEKLLIASPYWVPAGLCYQMWNSLSGYSQEMQNLMVHNLGDFLWGFGRKLTGIDHVDSQLLTLYREIYEFAKEHGEKLECPCLF